MPDDKVIEKKFTEFNKMHCTGQITPDIFKSICKGGGGGLNLGRMLVPSVALV